MKSVINRMLMVGLVITLSVQGQVVSDVPPLHEAIALHNEGKVQEAGELLLTIGTNSSDYSLARGYRALCQYELNDRLGFLKSMKSPAVQQAAMPADLQEELACGEMEALFFYRKFSEVLPKVLEFQKKNPDSACLDAVNEYQMASLFERGMKNAGDATLSKEAERFDTRWAEGKADLEQFLALASAFKDTNYTTIPKRALQEDFWTARMTLGEEDAAFEEIPAQDAAAQERLSLLRLRLYQKLQPDQIDENLQRMTNFLAAFPESASRSRVEFDLASLSFPRGKQLIQEAEAAEQAGDAETAATKREQASSYFETQRALQSKAGVDKAAGIEASDIADLREDLLYGYYLQKDFTTLAKLTASLAANAKPGEPDWLLAKFFDGVVSLHQSPDKPDAAAAVFDGILAVGFTGKPDHDHLVLAAVKWRIELTLKAGDRPRVTTLVQWVRESACPRDMKAAFLENYECFGPITPDND